MELRLSHRLTLVFSLFGLAIAGGLQYSHIQQSRAITYARERHMTEAASAAVKALVESHFHAGTAARLGKSLEELVRQTDIASIVVVDARDRRLTGRFDDSRLLTRAPRLGVDIDKVEDGIYDIQRDVSLGARGQGLLHIGFRTGRIEARLAELKGKAVRAGVMAFLAIALAAWLIGTWFGLRIEQIVPRIEALPRDPVGFRPLRVMTGGDEVSRLAEAFNRLGASLKSETLRRRELEREKQELSAMLVHDLKTPLTVIRSGITLLQEQLSDSNGAARGERRTTRALPGTHQRTFELLEMSADRLSRMVEDVLQLARLEELAGLKERVSVDLGAMIQACVKDFAMIAADRQQKIAVKLPREALPRVPGDPTLLRRVLDNLVHNAVEHTPNGGQVTVAANAENSHVRVSVSDTGPGVPAEARADLFRKFFQKDLKRHVGNVGLGLALCEKVILRHDGAIGIEDAKPKGACFYFLLPSEQPHLL